MERTFFSIKDLIEFCKTKKCYNFSAKNPNERIKIREVGTFSAEGEDNDKEFSVKLKSCHVGRNLNQSFISKESMKTAMPSFKGKPILGAFVQNEDTKEWDFNGHDMQLYEDENGNVQVKYIEQIIGNISEIEEPYLEYDENQDKDYVIVKGKIFREYTKAEEILKRRNSCACSVELAVNDMSYNLEEDCIELNSFVFSGVTLLGETVAPGMAGSKLVIESFANNNMNYQEKLIETLEKLTTAISSFNIENSKEGVEGNMSHFEELLEQYGFTAEEIDFEHDGMTDEELDAAFEDYACRKKKKCSEEGQVDPTGEAAGTENEACKKKKKCAKDSETKETNACGTKKKKKKCSIDENGDMTIEYSVSHDDIRFALYNLIKDFEDSDDSWYDVYEVYDDYFVMRNWDNGKFYKMGYSVNGENVALEGERVEVFQMLLTESEKIAIDKLRGDYSELEAKYNELKAFKDNYDATELKTQKDAVFADEDYDDIREIDGFKAIVAEADKFSVDELKVKCDLLYSAEQKKKVRFAKQEEAKKNGGAMKFSVKSNDEAKKKPYGDLFL